MSLFTSFMRPLLISDCKHIMSRSLCEHGLRAVLGKNLRLPKPCKFGAGGGKGDAMFSITDSQIAVQYMGLPQHRFTGIADTVRDSEWHIKNPDVSGIISADRIHCQNLEQEVIVTLALPAMSGT